MKEYRASTGIAAPPDEVWSLLVDGAAYPEWDPGMVRVEGHLALGETVQFFTTFSPKRAFAVKVTAFEPGRRMELSGGLPFGLFRSQRTHTLTPTATGGTDFRTEERFGGPLLPVFGRSLPDLTPSFEAFAAGLKARAESGR